MKPIFLCGRWLTTHQQREVRHPYDGHVVEVVAQATPQDVTRAIDGLQAGAADLRRRSAAERAAWLQRAAQQLRDQSEAFAQIITLEEGKTLAEARTEVARAAETLALSAEEGCRLTGEMVPLEGSSAGAGKLGFTLRVPCGIVAAITPFNFPLNLVCHKVGPALAGGNAVLIKPASATPLTALRLVELLLNSGVPEAALACLPGPGEELGRAICGDPRIRKISFTGSHAVGEQICHQAGLKRITMELGGNAPVIVLDDADVEQAAAAIVRGGFSNAGQVCISAQRILAVRRVADDLRDALQPHIAQLKAGDPRDPSVQMGPMIAPREAERVAVWIEEAVQAGGRVVAGGGHHGALHQPTLLDHLSPHTRFFQEELFGPAVGIMHCQSVDEAFAWANASRYGLAASLFTRDLERAAQFLHTVDAGNLHINGTTQWRADLMPYGGLKASGFGKEGPRYALREMTEEKLVVWHMP
ncbi:MAG: aldehyde dehydrogenase [Planctomycetaceae bacterium]|nr:MAG: aldehyde dehydrogenase [Planctomycetaceae bacterium]